jgi:hypothetical protein
VNTWFQAFAFKRVNSCRYHKAASQGNNLAADGVTPLGRSDSAPENVMAAAAAGGGGAAGGGAGAGAGGGRAAGFHSARAAAAPPPEPAVDPRTMAFNPKTAAADAEAKKAAAAEKKAAAAAATAAPAPVPTPAAVMRSSAVGLCTLNQVDPYPIAYSLSNP